MKKTWTPKSFFIDTVYFTVGSVLYALGIYTFALNARFAPGGVSGLALIVNFFTSWPVGTLTFVMNIPLIILCARVIGLPFLLKSIWAMLVNTFFIDVVFPFFPTYGGSPLVAAVFTGVVMGLGIGIIYSRGSSTGGFDFIILALKKKYPHFSVGEISLVLDAVVILLGGFMFGNVDAVLYGIIASFSATTAMDYVMYGLGSGKMAIIITNRGKEMAEAISAEVERGSTLVPATGSYTGQPRDMLFCVCSKNQIFKVRRVALAIDPAALLTITETHEVVGEGFQPLMVPGHETPGRHDPQGQAPGSTPGTPADSQAPPAV